MSRSRRHSVPGSPVSALEPRFLLAAISFEPPDAYRVSNSPTPVTVGDFNRDGVNDLAVAGEDFVRSPIGRASVRLLLGKLVPAPGGAGTTVVYEPGPTTQNYAGVQATGIVAADFDRDGNLDVAVSNNTNPGAVWVLLGHGDGTFAEALRYASGAASTGLAAADFDRDGKVDLVVSNAEMWDDPGTDALDRDWGAALLTGNGDGTFATARRLQTPGPQHFVEAGDVNGDGVVDAIFGRVVIGPGDFVAPRSEVLAALGDGAGRFAVGRPTEIYGAIAGMDAGDVDGDGRADAAVALMYDFMRGGDAAVLYGRADGTLAPPPPTYRATEVVSDVAIADLDADGRPDLAVAGSRPSSLRPYEVGEVITYRNLGGRSFGDARFTGLVGYPARLAVGRLNRDPLPDLAVTIPRGGGVAVLLNRTPALFVRGLRVGATAGAPLVDRPVARFLATGLGDGTGAGAFEAAILWGDGTGRQAGKVVANDDGTFSVLGSHTYRRAGTYRVTIVVRWADAGVTKVAYTSARVTPATTVRPT
jgi:hypothetical protein